MPKRDLLDEIVTERTKKNPAFPALVKKASGRNIAEAERNTSRVVLRLPPEAADDLDELADLMGLPKSVVVAMLVGKALNELTDGR